MNHTHESAVLPAGTRLGGYEIVELIGEGGMGQVYRAQDLKLRRDIALKLLPSATAGDPERRARFEREARAVAALNHSGIVTIHSVDEADSRLFLTMELVDGRPLSQLIPSAGFTLGPLLSIAVPLADAVAAAHARGITHRDLKPANVMVTGENRVKVLDFGLAKSFDPGNGDGHTVTTPAEPGTGEGRIIGTIAYMSPEQAEGRVVDARSDIFSLGVMLYEMATGARPFAGDTSMSTLAAIMRDTPRPVSEVNPAIPKELSRIIRRALSKDPERRQQTAKELRNELDDLRRELESGELVPLVAERDTGIATARAAAAPSSSSGHVPIVPGAAAPAGRGRMAVGAALVLVLVAATAWWRWNESRDTPRADASALTVESVSSVTSERGVETSPSLSPDGKWIVYTGSDDPLRPTDILLRAVGGQTVINLTKDSPTADQMPAFSPDGDRIAFRSGRDGGGIFVMGRTGESVRRLTSEGYNPAWSPDGKWIAYATEPAQNNPRGRGGRSALRIINESTGERRTLDVPDGMQPAWSPDGLRIVFWALPLSGDGVQRDLWNVPVSGGAPVQLTDDAAIDWSPVWLSDGFVYYSSDRSGSFNLWRVAVDQRSGRPAGSPEPVTVPRQGVAHLSFAADGRTFAVTSLTPELNVEGLTYDPVKEVVTDRRRITNSSEVASAPSLSSDRQRVAFYRTTNGQEDLWMVNVDGSGLRQLTNDPAHDRNPVWMPGDKRVLFYSDRGGRYQIWTIGVDGGEPQQVTDFPGLVIQARLTRDGARAFANVPLLNRTVLFNPNVAAAQQRQPADELAPFADGVRFSATSWSPDGRSIVGQAARNAGGIFIYDLADRRYTELHPTGTAPTWLPNGRQILFVDDGRRLQLLDAKTRALKTVFAPTPYEGIAAPEISSDQKLILTVISENQADIVVAKLSPRS